MEEIFPKFHFVAQKANIFSRNRPDRPHVFDIYRQTFKKYPFQSVLDCLVFFQTLRRKFPKTGKHATSRSFADQDFTFPTDNPANRQHFFSSP